MAFPTLSYTTARPARSTWASATLTALSLTSINIGASEECWRGKRDHLADLRVFRHPVSTKGIPLLTEAVTSWILWQRESIPLHSDARPARQLIACSA